MYLVDEAEMEALRARLKEQAPFIERLRAHSPLDYHREVLVLREEMRKVTTNSARCAEILRLIARLEAKAELLEEILKC